MNLPHHKAESRTGQILKFLDLRIGPATFAVVFAAGALWMKIDGNIDAQKQISADFVQHQKDDSKKFEKLTNVVIKFEAWAEDLRARVTRVENRVDGTIPVTPR